MPMMRITLNKIPYNGITQLLENAEVFKQSTELTGNQMISYLPLS